jgi:hypothetical protein
MEKQLEEGIPASVFCFSPLSSFLLSFFALTKENATESGLFFFERSKG